MDSTTILSRHWGATPLLLTVIWRGQTLKECRTVNSNGPPTPSFLARRLRRHHNFTWTFWKETAMVWATIGPNSTITSILQVPITPLRTTVRVSFVHGLQTGRWGRLICGP